ncbi:Os05g0100750, partial [Oryza sativa Japonica Group]
MVNFWVAVVVVVAVARQQAVALRTVEVGRRAAGKWEWCRPAWHWGWRKRLQLQVLVVVGRWWAWWRQGQGRLTVRRKKKGTP